MNSDNPQQPQNSYPKRFEDHDDISVSYEEISPEEQSRLKQEVKSQESSAGGSESLTDMWSMEKSESLPDKEVEWQETTASQSSPPTNDQAQKQSQQQDPEPNLANSLSSDPELANPTLTEDNLDLDLGLTNNESQSEPQDLAQDNPIAEITAPDQEEIPESDDSPDKNMDLDAISDMGEDIGDLDNLLNDGARSLLEEPDSPEELPSESEEKAPATSSVASKSPELIAAGWLDDIEQIEQKAKAQQSSPESNQTKVDLNQEIAELKVEKTNLIAEIQDLKRQKELAIAEQTEAVNLNLAQMIQEGTRELREQKNRLFMDIEKLERRRQRIDKEMRETFAGSSQDLAMRIQGFKKYLVGSLQDLSTAAEKLELPQAQPPQRPTREPRQDREPIKNRGGRPAQDPRAFRQERPYNSSEGRRPDEFKGGFRDEPRSSNRRPRQNRREEAPVSQTKFGDQAFDDKNRRIRQLLEQYRTRPDYYGAPWQLRRTFESVHSERVQEWFFGQGGRGTIKGMGSRLQNILVASAIISVSHQLYRDRCRILVLVDSPEKLGEWRRGLCDCLGISRNDFGPNRGIDLFDSADVLVQRAERLIDDKLMPLVVIDEAEGLVNLGLLKFPLWLAFSEKPQQRNSGYSY